MNKKELKKLAVDFVEKYIDYEYIGIDDISAGGPPTVKIIYDDSVAEIVGEYTAIRYFGSSKEIYETKDFTFMWREYLLTKLNGKAKLKYVNNFLDLAYSDLGNVEIDIDKNDFISSSVSKEELESAVEHITNLATIKFDIIKENIQDIESGRDIEKQVCVDHNKFIRLIKNMQDEFLQTKVERSFNAKGEEVFNFTEEQYELYEAFKDAIETIDFSMRYKLYKKNELVSKFENE